MDRATESSSAHVEGLDRPLPRALPNMCAVTNPGPLQYVPRKAFFFASIELRDGSKQQTDTYVVRLRQQVFLFISIFVVHLWIPGPLLNSTRASYCGRITHTQHCHPWKHRTRCLERGSPNTHPVGVHTVPNGKPSREMISRQSYASVPRVQPVHIAALRAVLAIGRASDGSRVNTQNLFCFRWTDRAWRVCSISYRTHLPYGKYCVLIVIAAVV